MSHYNKKLVACDFFTVETIFLKSIFVFVFIELGSRTVYLAGITGNPDGFWVAQQARQFVWQFEDTTPTFHCLIRANDSKYTDSFDTIFESQKIRVIPTPFQAPKANVFAERWVRTIRLTSMFNMGIWRAHHEDKVLIVKACNFKHS